MNLRIHKLQMARRTVQYLVLVLILVIPVLARYGNYLSARELDKFITKWDGTLQGETLVAADAVLRSLPGGELERAERMVRDRQRVLRYAQSLRGGPWSLEIGPLSLTDPLAAAESIAASKRAAGVLWISLIIPLLVTLLLGRVFCSWICPMGLLTELTDKLRRLLRFLELRPLDLPIARATKHILLACGLLIAALFSLPLLGHVYPPAIIGRELHDLVFGIFDRAEMGRFGFWAGGLTWMTWFLLVIVVLEIALSRRWWCRYVCPGGALYILFGWLRPLRVHRSASRCTDCGACDTACHLGLKPMQDRLGIECDNCGLCISHCADDAIGYVVQVGDRRQ